MKLKTHWGCKTALEVSSLLTNEYQTTTHASVIQSSTSDLHLQNYRRQLQDKMYVHLELLLYSGWYN